MNVQINPAPLCGEIAAPPSKSVAHRALILAAFAQGESRLTITQSSADIDATADCLRALGVQIEKQDHIWTVTPPEKLPHSATLDCGESGSTLRFLLPVVCACGVCGTFVGHGRLPERPLQPLVDVLRAHGVTISDNFPLQTSGTLQPGEFPLPGNVSSQFITGLLLALPLLAEPSAVTVLPPVESKPYIDITTAVMRDFGVTVAAEGLRYRVAPKRPHAGAYIVEGDWSNAAFGLCMGARVTGLNLQSVQGDRKVLDIIKDFGAVVFQEGDSVQANLSALHGADIDAADVPDLVPVLAAVAATAQGETTIHNAARLRLKESDRIVSTAAMLRAVGGDVKETPDGLIVRGKPQLSGGTVDSFNDHRIVMAAAVLAQHCAAPVIIRDAQAVKKSCPAFFETLQSLGGDVHVL